MSKIIKLKVKHVLPSAGYFEICKYNKKGKSVKYKLLDRLNPLMTQENLAEFYEFEKKKGNPLPLNSIQFMELLEDTADSENNKLKNYVHKSLKENWINTLTRVIYNPIGKKDETIHNYGTSDSYSIIGDIVGEDNWIKNINNKNALESLLKINDVEKLNKISNAINQTPMYLWRLNSKTSEKQESVVRFDAYGGVGRLDLSAYGDPSDQDPAFLVERVE